jgi:hypothetical integral membrane protein (TIGR02206 family)
MKFQPFSHEHIFAVLIGFSITAVFLWAGKRGGSWRRIATALLALLNLTAFPLNLMAWKSLGVTLPLDNILPLHLCDIAAMIAGFALLTRRPMLCALTYFWGLAATFQALLTPALSEGFPSWPFVTFFIQHFAIVAAALFLPMVDGWRPKQPFWSDPLRVYGWTVVYLVLVSGVNIVIGTNFGFTLRPPDNPSLIDHLGPWPWYLFSILAIGMSVFLLLTLPFRRSKNRGC